MNKSTQNNKKEATFLGIFFTQLKFAQQFVKERRGDNKKIMEVYKNHKRVGYLIVKI